MDWIIDSGLRFGRLVVALAIGLTVIAIAQLRSAPVDVYPEFMPPSVEIQTEALGLSAAEVEQLITLGLEQDLLNGVPWLDRIHSSSMPGLSAIDLTFQPGTDLYAARQQVQERLTQAHALPNVGSSPIMIQPTAAAGRVAMIKLSSSSVSPIDMSVLARWEIKPRPIGVPGVANGGIYGQPDRQLQGHGDPQKPRARHATASQPVPGHREVPRRGHAEGHQGRRGRDGGYGPGPEGHRRRHPGVPPGQLRRGRAAERRMGRADRLHAADRLAARHVRLVAGRADRRDPAAGVGHPRRLRARP